MAENSAVILFDGTCLLCSRIVAFIIPRDARAVFRFVPLQSDPGHRLLKSHGLDGHKFDSIVLLESGKWKVESAAVLGIARRLPLPWPLLYALIAVPRPFVMRYIDGLHAIATAGSESRRFVWFQGRNGGSGS